MRIVLAVILAVLLLLVVLWAALAAGSYTDDHPIEARTSSTLLPPVSETPSAPASSMLPVTSTSMPRSHETAPMASLGRPDIEAIIREGFSRFGSSVAEQAIGVAWCEARLDPAVTNGPHVGLFQVSRLYHADRVARLGFTWDQMTDPRVNVAVAVDIYAESGWQPWTCRWAA